MTTPIVERVKVHEPERIQEHREEAPATRTMQIACSPKRRQQRMERFRIAPDERLEAMEKQDASWRRCPAWRTKLLAEIAPAFDGTNSSSRRACDEQPIPCDAVQRNPMHPHRNDGRCLVEGLAHFDPVDT